MSKPRLLDLFCGAGGASMGYAQAGFEVVGVDIKPQPHYPFVFIQGDAATFPLKGFDVIHASPPCQAYSALNARHRRAYPELVEITRARLAATGVCYVIENVVGAPLNASLLLCGTMFPGLRVLRHRLFESNVFLWQPLHYDHPLVYTHDRRKAHYKFLDERTAFVQVTGGGNCSKAAAQDAMGIDWMTKAEMNEAIPPAYTRFIGDQLMDVLTR
jgi:DNA (cytosine-5)-methyltransferase 1